MTTAKAKKRYDAKRYGELLLETLPGPIESEKDNEKALEIIERLMDKRENRSPEETRLFLLLSQLVETYEEKTYPIGSKSAPADVLRLMMDEHGLKQRDVAYIFGSQGIVSEVLSGKREISRTAAKKLGERFQVPADLFI